MKLLVKKQFPRVVGLEIAGEVIACGPGASRFEAHDLVYGHLLDPFGKAHGGYGELMAVPEAAVAKMPAGLSFIEAASLPVAYSVAHIALRELQQGGANLLVVGGSGGVGVIAIQLAKHLGLEVTAVCSGTHADLVLSLGADHVIDRRRQDYARCGQRFDVVLDLSKPGSYWTSRRILTKQGDYITTIPGPKAFAAKAWTALSSQRVHMVDFRGRPMGSVLAEGASLVEAGAIRSVVAQTFPLQDVAKAHVGLEAGTLRGKAVLVLDAA